MDILWITLNEKLLQGTMLINSISLEKYKQLLHRVIESKTKNVLTPEEFALLEKALNLNSNEALLLVQCLKHIFKQSGKIIIKPTVLQKQLIECLRFNTDKAEEFVKAWSSTTKTHFENLENRNKVEGISWELNVQSCSSQFNKECVVNARIKFETKGIGSNADENVIFQLNDQELLQMYSALENIQNTLDNIQNNST